MDVDGLLTADGFDAAIIGIGSRCGQPDIVAYDVEKVIEILTEDGMSHEEAVEFYDFNIVGGWQGERTPLWVRTV
jgi:hypothetical protein